MENQKEGLPTDQPEVRQGLSDSFMEAMNPQEETPAEAPTEEVVEEPVAEDNVIEVSDAPEEKETPAEPALEIIEEVPEATVDPKLIQEVSYEVEGLDKLASFMKETGGTIEDYIALNKDYSSYSEDKLLEEYYSKTRPHLDADDLKFVLQDKFQFDEDADEEADIRKKTIARKEELYQAKKYLEESKEKFYTEIKSQVKGGASPEDLKAKQVAEENSKFFQSETNKFFEGFKGFDFKVGENTVRYKVENTDTIKDYQSDLSNLVGEFLGDDGKVADVSGYHKAVFAAKNADKIAQLFYDQGYAMAVKEQAKSSKNTDFSPQHHEPSSSTKLAPGQAREIAHPNAGKSSQPKVRLSNEFWKK